MNGLQKIGDLATRYGISSRTLRYYEEIGLLKSSRESDTQQRWFDEGAVTRLEQILLLRRLELPIKEVQEILSTQELQVAVDAFARKLQAIDQELGRLQELHDLVSAFLTLLRERGYARGAAGLLQLQGDLVLPAAPARKETIVMPRASAEGLTHVRIVELKPTKVGYYRAVS
ncbi:MAG TPA: MerR family transcriptional regulator, partial [Symbiobacteriaceae bacterium]|nr:MerR family transcriptional regulator [Symbiobacteriaceae bacterium]